MLKEPDYTPEEEQRALIQGSEMLRTLYLEAKEAGKLGLPPYSPGKDKPEGEK